MRARRLGATRPEREAAVLVMLSVAVLLPAPGAAQGVCAAPHSTGGMTGSSTVGTLPAGDGWMQVAALRWVSDEFYGSDGELRPLLAEGVSTTHSLYFTASLGLVSGIEVWLQAPLHSLEFEDQTGRRTRTGIGDIRAAVRVSGAAVRLPGFPVVLRAGVKLPGSSFPVDATVIPLTEGQRDWELSAEYGHALVQPSPLAPPTLYGVGWLGYRWRETNEEAARRPGDELFAHLAFGGLLDPFSWQLALETVQGSPPVQQGVELTSADRELWQVGPTVFYPLGPGRLSAGALIPLSGRNLPAGPSLSVGYLLSGAIR